MSANPYEIPKAHVEDVTAQAAYQPIRIWSTRGRIGRLRYLAYSTAASLLVGLIASVTTMMFGASAGSVITVLTYLGLFAIWIPLGIQRSHDMNWPGWTFALGIIPLISLIWIFNSGTRGANRYGNPPPPNTVAIKVFGLLLPAVFLLGILAAIAIPAYQQYAQRVQAQAE